MPTTWNPAQYDKFKAQRAKPFFDLMGLVKPGEFDSVVDLGCGTGELTRRLFDYLKPKKLIGIDSSKTMLKKSEALSMDGLSFELRDIATYQPESSLDIVFSNAALQWVPAHETLFPRLLGWIRPGGQVAIQIPFNFDHPPHEIAKSVALRLFPSVFPAEKNFSGTLGVEKYAEILFEHGFENQIARVEVYGHPLPSGAEVVEWTKGTLLTAYQEQLSRDQFAQFLENYQRDLIERIGKGPYFYAFKRILIWGMKK